MGEINKRITDLEKQTEQTKTKVDDLSIKTEQKETKPYSKVGGSQSKGLIHPADISSGLSQVYGGSIPWNAWDLLFVPYGTAGIIPTERTPCYNLHSHSRYTGGALIAGIIEVVEYDWAAILNKYAPQHWKPFPKPMKELNSKGEAVEKIGILDLVFNPDTKSWGTPAYEIDVKKCYLIERDVNGNITVDSKGQQKRSPLYNTDQTKTSIVWDESGNCWRLYSVYAPGV